MILPALAASQMWLGLFCQFMQRKKPIPRNIRAEKGLPSVLDTLYFYNRSAVDDLGEVLEQSEREKVKYTEREAELMLTHLIYRELKRGAAEK